MTKKKNHRRRLWIATDIQGAVVRKIILYWLACILFVTLPLLINATFRDPSKYFFQHSLAVFIEYWPVYISLLCLLPLALFDSLRITNRIAGPIVRLQKQLDGILAGDAVKRMSFRDDDYWHELAVKVNKVSELVDSNRSDKSA